MGIVMVVNFINARIVGVVFFLGVVLRVVLGFGFSCSTGLDSIIGYSTLATSSSTVSFIVSDSSVLGLSQ